MQRERSSSRRGVSAAVIAALALTAGPARAADPSPSDKALAETLFQAGRKLLDEGKTAEGCEKIESSQRLEPKTGTLLNMALCHEQLGKTATAWAEMIEVASQAARLKQEDRVTFAKDRVAALEKKLSRLTITAPAKPPGLTVSLDGKPLETSALGLAVPLDPGDHVIEAAAPGKAPFRATVAIQTGPSSKTQEIPPLSEGEPTKPLTTATPTSTLAPSATSSPSSTTSSNPGPGAPPETGGNGLFLGGVIAASAGALGLAAGGIFGGLAISKEAEATKICPDHFCPKQEGVDMHREAKGLANISTATFAVGIAAAGAGITMLLLSRRPAPPTKTGFTPWIAPTLTPTEAGLFAGARF